jgi:uncharacterized protein DUF6602
MSNKGLSNKGQRIRDFFNNECRSLLSTYRNIESLIPSENNNGASHKGEEGRHIESLIRAFLNKHLPKELEALSGFIIRPAVKVGDNDRQRRQIEQDQHSTQIDIIVYDSTNYPIYERFEEFVIVPPEGVISVISVKKNLYEGQLNKELENLIEASQLCVFKNRRDEIVRGPSTSIVSFSNRIKTEKSFEDKSKWIFQRIVDTHKLLTFDQCIGQIVCLDEFTVFKRRPNSDDENEFNKRAEYVGFRHGTEEECHMGLQFLITGILSAYHHPSRKMEARPGFTSFQSGRKEDVKLGLLKTDRLRMLPKNYIK